jgi:hypothetical protein
MAKPKAFVALPYVPKTTGYTDHGFLSGLGDDDHTQYHNDTRGDVRYYTKTANDTLLALKVDKVGGKGLSTEDYTTAEKTKLSGVATGATANSTDATLLSRANHTGTQLAATISDFNTAVATTAALKANNLSDLASAATARTNLGLGTAATTASTAYDASGAASTAQAFAIQRANHTGTQLASTISDFNAQVATTAVLKSIATTKGDIISATGSAVLVRKGAGSDGQALLSDSTQTDGLRWGSPTATAAWNYLTKTSNFTAAANDYVTCTTNSFNITLPTAVGVSGQSIYVRNFGTSLTNKITILTTSAQSLQTPTGAVASGSYVLCTKGEGVKWTSNGTDWDEESHTTNTKWTDFPSLAVGTLITATTTNPTTYGTIANHYAQWRRSGPDMFIRWFYRQTAAGNAGSGAYLFNMMSGAVIDTATIPVNTGITYAPTAVDSNVGWFSGFVNATTQATGPVVVYSTTQLKVIGLEVSNASTSASGVMGVQFTFATAAAMTFSLNAQVPITDWRP